MNRNKNSTNKDFLENFDQGNQIMIKIPENCQLWWSQEPLSCTMETVRSFFVAPLQQLNIRHTVSIYNILRMVMWFQTWQSCCFKLDYVSYQFKQLCKQFVLFCKKINRLTKYSLSYFNHIQIFENFKYKCRCVKKIYFRHKIGN